MLVESRPEYRRTINFFEGTPLVADALDQTEGASELSQDTRAIVGKFAFDVLSYVFDPNDHTSAELSCSVANVRGQSYENLAMRVAATTVSTYMFRHK